MSAIDRMYKYFELKGIKAAQFEKDHGYASGYFSKRKGKDGGLNEKSLKRIIEDCPDLNPIWLIVGIGKITIKQQEEASSNLVIQENLRLRKELLKVEGAIDIFLKRENVFGGSLEELKQRYSEVIARIQEIEDNYLPDD